MAEDPKDPKELRFVYEKARHHRTLHADGAWSAVTPHAEVQISFYNDLRRMPVSVALPIREDDSVGPEEPLEISDLVREVDITVVMNIETAKAAVAILNQMIAQAEPIIQKAAARRANDQASKVDSNG
jgi:hypothetical protein